MKDVLRWLTELRENHPGVVGAIIGAAVLVGVVSWIVAPMDVRLVSSAGGRLVLASAVAVGALFGGLSGSGV